MGCLWKFLIAVYLLLTVVAAYILSDGFSIQFSLSVLFLLAIVWPVLLYLILVSYYEEWRRRLKEN